MQPSKARDLLLLSRAAFQKGDAVTAGALFVSALTCYDAEVFFSQLDAEAMKCQASAGKAKRIAPSVSFKPALSADDSYQEEDVDEVDQIEEDDEYNDLDLEQEDLEIDPAFPGERILPSALSSDGEEGVIRKIQLAVNSPIKVK